MKFLILLPYYNRPNLVKNALKSIIKANSYYDNWKLAFIDDGSNPPARSLVEETFKDFPKKVKYYNTKMSKNDKIEKGCFVGAFLNTAMLKIDADICVLLNDDDELVPDSLYKLNTFFENNDAMSCWSKVHIYNPYFEKSEEVNNVVGPYNQWEGPIEPFNRVEGCQVAWRKECFTKHYVKFEYPCTGNHDAYFLQELYRKTGPCAFSGIVSQYKALHANQLSRRAFDSKFKWGLNPEKAWNYVETNDIEIEKQTFTKMSILHAGHCQQQGDNTTAIKILKNYLKVDENALVRFTLGVILATMDVAEGIIELEKAKSLAQEEANKLLCENTIKSLKELESKGTRPKTINLPTFNYNYGKSLNG